MCLSPYSFEVSVPMPYSQHEGTRLQRLQEKQRMELADGRQIARGDKDWQLDLFGFVSRVEIADGVLKLR